MNVNVKIKKLRENAVVPKYATEGSAALDLYAAIDKEITIKAHERCPVPTGIALAPEGNDVVSVVCARSGLAAKHGIALANGIGIIDSDYRGELIVALLNNSDTDYTVTPGERIAQLMFMPVLCANIILADQLDETARGAGGFGSTGRI